MARLTQRNGVHVEYLKDGEAFPYTLMSGYDIQRVLNRLAELEDGLEQGELEYIPHGKWEPVVWKFDGVEAVFYQCSECLATVCKSNYCPNCGARMDGENNG